MKVVRRLIRGVDAGIEGQAMVEYALILTLVAAVCVGALSAFGAPLSSIFQNVADGF